MLSVRLDLLAGDQKHSLGRGMGVVEGQAGGPFGIGESGRASLSRDR